MPLKKTYLAFTFPFSPRNCDVFLPDCSLFISRSCTNSCQLTTLSLLLRYHGDCQPQGGFWGVRAAAAEPLARSGVAARARHLGAPKVRAEAATQRGVGPQEHLSLATVKCNTFFTTSCAVSSSASGAFPSAVAVSSLVLLALRCTAGVAYCPALLEGAMVPATG